MTWNGEWHTPDAGDFQGYVTLQFDTRDSAVPVPNYATHYVQTIVDLKPPYVRIFWLDDGETFTTRDLSIEGAGESYAQIILTATRAADNAAFTAETSCNGLGDWSATLSVDQDGIYTITAQAIDRAGNTGELSQPLTVIVDTTGPVITDVSVSDRVIQTGYQDIQARAVVVDSLSRVENVKVFVNDDVSGVNESTLSMYTDRNVEDGYVTGLVTDWLSEGHKNVIIQAKDEVGNLTENPESEGFIVDGTKPSISGPILSLLSGAQNLYPNANTLYYGPASSGSFNVLIEASDQDPIIDTSGLEILLFPAIFNDPPRQLDAHGAMTQTVNVTYTVIAAQVANPSYSILVYDRSNNQNSVVLKLTHDETPPVIEQLLFSAANSTNTYLQTDTRTLYYGPASAGTLVATALVTDSGSGVKGVFSPAIFGAGGEFDSAQPYSREYMINNSDVTEGFYDWTAEDRVGNKGNSGATQGITIVYDTESPVAAITLPNEAGMVFPISWSASDSLSGISTYDVQFKDGINGTWTFWQTAVSYTEGKFTGIPGHQVYFRARATDRVGNTGAWTEAKLITIAGQEPIKYYTFNGQRVALRKGRGSSAPVYYLHGDHLGSVSLTTDQAGQVVAETRSLPYGDERWSSGIAQTDFGFTGQRKDGFGLMDYNARYYSPYLSRWIQPDTVIPDPFNPQDFDRYSYVRNNPINYIDSSGHTPWFITGWNVSYLFQQSGNTCAVASIAVSLSILRGHAYTEADIQPIFPHTYDLKIKLPFDSSGQLTLPTNPHAKWEEKNLALGVIPAEQALGINIMFPGQIRATFSQGNRADLMNNLNNGCPTIVSIALPYDQGIGHALVVIGYDPATKELQFYNPAYGKIETENEILTKYNYNGFTTFDDLWAASNDIIPGNAMVTLRKVSTSQIISASGGGGIGGVGFMLR